LGQTLGWDVHKEKIMHWRIVLADKFGQSRFPDILVSLLCALNERDCDAMLQCIDQVLKYFRKHLKHSFPLYPAITVSDDGLIKLDYPTKTYDYIFDFIKKNCITSVLDMYSTDTGIGLKLAQDFPNIAVTVVCRADKDKEIYDTQNIITHSLTYNASIIVGIKPQPTEKYDLIIYHNLFRPDKFQEISRVIRGQITHYCIIEVPLKGDKVLVKKNLGYEYLQTPFDFRSHLCSNQIKVNRCLKINYDDNHYKRYLFICGGPTASV
jgi:hypothetical protein